MYLDAAFPLVSMRSWDPNLLGTIENLSLEAGFRATFFHWQYSKNGDGIYGENTVSDNE